MRHHLLFSSTASAAAMPPSCRKPPPCPHTCAAANSLCKHSPSATLDLLILILVLFAATFLIVSYFSYIFHSLSLLLPPFSLSSLAAAAVAHLQAQPVFYASLFVSALTAFALFEICCGARSRKCGRAACKGLKKAMEFDLQLQGEECLKPAGKAHRAVRDIDELPWKGGSELNPDYECLRAELRKMAPPNGRAVLLFRAKCGCPVAKLEGWGPKRGRRQKKSLALCNDHH